MSFEDEGVQGLRVGQSSYRLELQQDTEAIKGGAEARAQGRASRAGRGGDERSKEVVRRVRWLLMGNDATDSPTKRSIMLITLYNRTYRTYDLEGQSNSGLVWGLFLQCYRAKEFLKRSAADPAAGFPH